MTHSPPQENPTIPAVYEIQSTPFGPRKDHEPRVYAYFDGVDTWSAWAFSVGDAYRAKPAPGVSYKWEGDPLDLPHHTSSQCSRAPRMKG